MAEITKYPCPPYATFAPFLNFLNKLRDTQVPSRIDPSVFGNASGSLSYSVIAALKVLKLIDASGAPKRAFVELVNASDEERPHLLREALPAAYPTFFDGTFNINTATAGQFDEHLRERYDARGSTIDKVASFFIAAANYTNLGLSQLVKDRKPTASSASSGRSKKQRRQVQETGGAGETPPPPPPPQVTEKALEYKLVDLMSEALEKPDVMQAIITVVTFLKSREAEKKKTAANP
ncbi:MAG TPA: DUF5343 domain-containing protein [Sphingomicrobium sp.]|nr:DUF5343 domain-containing protein [Sphingomicrobium sp.]